MDHSLIDDLSRERPSGSGKYKFRTVLRVPLVGLKLTIAAQAPHRAPAATALATMVMSFAALLVPAVSGLAATQAHLPSWTGPATTAAFAALMIGATSLALWFQNGWPPIRHDNLADQAPTGRATLLVDDTEAPHEPLQQHELAIATRKGESLMSGDWSSPARSIPGVATALLLLAIAALLSATVFVWLGTVVHTATMMTLASAFSSCLAIIACGITMIVRVEQVERRTTPPGNPGPGQPR